ncbi:aminotransferase [Sulfurovum lithotrophicum]|uniref:cysteine-S-conjugate beta-lyase n=1 Tax=Sulfurovum lithotrophicum TaxID=206403 RepID=A0A7U4RR36_9BACT|nr:PatB family C-S lyase [Sulfurovum lithotrophicum]AKF25528.1 aminotransferase [Sulfurovum lithotrophicum]
MMFEAVDRSGTYATKYDDAVRKFGTDDLLPMWVADMDLASPVCVQDALIKRAKHPLYGYTVYPERYYDAIESWYAKRYGWQIEREWIVPCYGVVPSMNFAIEAYTEKGDGILVQTPIYPPFVSSVKHRKRKVLENVLLYQDEKYMIDFADFETKAKEAKLFLLCSPHNPTGRAWDRLELEQIIKLCVENNVTIVSDEIHADMVFRKEHHVLGSFEKAQKHCVILNAPSKTFNVAGLNTSFSVIPNARLRRAYRLEQDKSGITNGNPFGIEALMSAYEKGEVWLEALKEYLLGNIYFVKTYLEEHRIPIIPVETEATFLMWLDCRAMGMTHENLVQFFIQKAKLGLNDGKSFGECGDGFMRLNIATSRKVLQEAMQRLEKAYREKK